MKKLSFALSLSLAACSHDYKVAVKWGNETFTSSFPFDKNYHVGDTVCLATFNGCPWHTVEGFRLDSTYEIKGYNGPDGWITGGWITYTTGIIIDKK